VLEVEPTGQRGRATTRSGQNGNEAVAASEAFARWPHYRYACGDVNVRKPLCMCTCVVMVDRLVPLSQLHEFINISTFSQHHNNHQSNHFIQQQQQQVSSLTNND